MSNNPKSGVLDPKLIKLDVKYTFTINPNDDFQYWKENEKERIRMSIKHANYVLSKMSCARCWLKMDISRVGRIHWHGTIEFKTFKNLRRFLLEHIHDLTLKHTIEIDTITDEKTWNDYCNKLNHLVDYEVKTETSSKMLMQLEGQEQNPFQKKMTDYC